MNNLTQREKILIYAIVAVLPIVLIFFGFSWFMGKLNEKSVELSAVTRQLSDINLRADMAMEKTLVNNELKQRSLSAQENVAQGEYREWLRSLVENEIEFKGTPKVTSRGNVEYKSDFGKKPVIYKQLSFQLDCQGSYKQIVNLLYRFYEKNYIHRISRLDLNLAKGKRVEGKVTFDRSKFNIKAHIQVLSLIDADDVRSPMTVANTKLFYQDGSQEKLIHQLSDYNAIILRRNLFGFPNNAPDFGSRKKSFDFEEGDRISVKLSADDEDDDELEFMLVSTDGKLNSDQIEQSRTGSFKLDIEALGTYEFKAKVVDKNYYPKTDEMLVVVNIEKKKEEKRDDPPPPKPKFDPLKFTFLEAIVRNFEGNPIAWINVRPYGKMHKVGDGAKFDVGKTAIEVVKINRRNAVISIDGDQYQFEVNDALGNPQGELLTSTRKKTQDGDGKTTTGANPPRKTIDVSTSKPEPPSPDINQVDEIEDGKARDDKTQDDKTQDGKTQDDKTQDDKAISPVKTPEKVPAPTVVGPSKVKPANVESKDLEKSSPSADSDSAKKVPANPESTSKKGASEATTEKATPEATNADKK